MAEETERFWNPATKKWETRTVNKSLDKLAEEKFNPALRKVDASSSSPPKGGLGAVAAAQKKKKPSQGDQAAAVEKY